MRLRPRAWIALSAKSEGGHWRRGADGRLHQRRVQLVERVPQAGRLDEDPLTDNLLPDHDGILPRALIRHNNKLFEAGADVLELTPTWQPACWAKYYERYVLEYEKRVAHEARRVGA